MKIEDFLNLVKANNRTYSNLDWKAKSDFKKLYNFLKKYKHERVSFIAKNRVNKVLNDKNELEYLRKYKAMQILAER